MSRSNTHPEFPSLPAGSRERPPPDNAADLVRLINDANTLEAVRDYLISALQRISEGENQVGDDPQQKIKSGEALLASLGAPGLVPDQQQMLGKTAALVYIFSARLMAPRITPEFHNEAALQYAMTLCQIGEESQLELCRGRVALLAEGVLKLAKHLRRVDLVIEPLYRLAFRAFPRGCFSGAHWVVLEACLLVRQYEPAKPIMLEIFTDLRYASPTYLDVLTFYHHAGLICAALKEYARAAEFFSVAVCTPTAAASAIQYACVKRAILCELIASGKPLVFPAYISGNITRNLERHAPEYLALAKAYEAADWTTVANARSTKAFSDDNNLGLVDHVIASIPRRKLIKVTNTYSKLTLSDLATKIGLTGEDATSTARQLFADLCAAGDLHGEVTGDPPVVTFYEESGNPDPKHVVEQIETANIMASWLESHLDLSSKRLAGSKYYLKKQATAMQVSGGKGKGKAGGGLWDTDAAEDVDPEKTRRMRGPGANYSDMGY